MIFLKKKNRSHNGASLWKGCKPWCPTKLKDKSGIIPARGASILPWVEILWQLIFNFMLFVKLLVYPDHVLILAFFYL